MPEQFLTPGDLAKETELTFTVAVHDPNGDKVGEVRYGEPGYAFFFDTVE